MIEKLKKNVLMIAALLLCTNATVVTAKTIKIATISPEGTFWMKQMRIGADLIKEKTRGRVKFKFYPGGVMGNDDNVFRKIKIGQLHGGAITLPTLSQAVPDVTIYGLPFLFSSLDEAEQIRTVSDDLLAEAIYAGGYVNFGIAQGGFTYLMSKHRITGFDDLRKQKSWVPEKSDVGLSVYKAIEVTPVSLPLSDVLTGLQTGLINTVVASPIGALALQWHTHINYVVDLPLNYLAAMLIIDRKVFEKLSPSDQKIVRDVMTDVYRKIDQHNKADDLAARQALKNQGVKFITLNAKEKPEWYRTGDIVIREMIDKYNYDKNIYKAVMANKPDAPGLD